MKKFRVVIPPVVQKQIRAQVLHIADDSVDRALDWEQRLRARIRKMRIMPLAQRIDEVASARLGVEIRKVVFEKTYLVFYKVDEIAGTVILVNFRHGARLRRRGEP